MIKIIKINYFNSEIILILLKSSFNRLKSINKMLILIQTTYINSVLTISTIQLLIQFNFLIWRKKINLKICKMIDFILNDFVAIVLFFHDLGMDFDLMFHRREKYSESRYELYVNNPLAEWILPKNWNRMEVPTSFYILFYLSERTKFSAFARAKNTLIVAIRFKWFSFFFFSKQ